MQLTFLPEIDRDKTRMNVEEALEKYKVMLLMNPEEVEPVVTSSFKLTPPTQRNAFSSSTEEVAIKKIDMEIQKEKYIKKIMKAINRLSYEERELIIERYLKNDYIYHYQAYSHLGYSESKYYRIRSDAFNKLAFILKIVVYKEVNTE